MSKRRRHHNAESGFSLYSENSVNSISPYTGGSRDQVTPDFRVPGLPESPEIAKVRRTSGCLRGCGYTPVSIFEINTVIFPLNTITNGSIVRTEECGTFDPDISSWIHSGGVCSVVYDGSGPYATAAECVSANTVGTPTFGMNGIEVIDFENYNLTPGGGPLGGGLYNLFQVEINVTSGFELSLAPVREYYKDGGIVDGCTQIEVGNNAGGGFPTLNDLKVFGFGVVEGNTFQADMTATTTGTTHPTLGFDATRYAWAILRNTTTMAEISREYFLSAAELNARVDFSAGDATPLGWTANSPSSYTQRISPVYSFAGLLATTDSLRWTFRNENGVGDIAEDPGGGVWQVVEAECSLNITSRLLRDTFADIPNYTRLFGQAIHIQDPNLGIIPLNPSKSNIIYEANLSQTFFVSNGDGFYHVFTKYGKERNPAINFLDREWLKIQHVIVDARPATLEGNGGLPGYSRTIYSNPELPPLVANNPYEEKTHTYQDVGTTAGMSNLTQFTNPCVFESSAIESVVTVDGNCFRTNLVDPSGAKVATGEVWIQQDCRGKLIEIRRPGVVFPSFTPCTF